jgi:four helix bundle protein
MAHQPINTYKDLIVWQRSMDLVVALYDLTDKFPRTEIYGLTSQIRRSAVSIPPNIAEGRRHGSRRDYRHFLIMAYASGAELETQVEISKRLPWGKNLKYTQVDSGLNEVMRMLNKMTHEINS